MSIKMKGLLKGLRYISQIFEEEEVEKEMEIGFPTDVKHVAHIGWDGPSVTSPSWMTEFKSPAPGNATASSPANGEEDSTTKKSVTSRDLPALPKSRRNPSSDSIGSVDSPLGSPSQKAKSNRRRHHTKQKDVNSPRGGESSNSQGLPTIPKKSRRKKSKDGEGSLKSSSKSKDKSSRNGSRHGSEDGSVSKDYSGEANSSTSLASLHEEGVKG